MCGNPHRLKWSYIDYGERGGSRVKILVFPFLGYDKISVIGDSDAFYVAKVFAKLVSFRVFSKMYEKYHS